MILRDGDVDKDIKLELYKESYPLIEKDYKDMNPFQFERRYLDLVHSWKEEDIIDKDRQLKYEVSVAIFEEFLEKKGVGRKKIINNNINESKSKIMRPTTIKRIDG